MSESRRLGATCQPGSSIDEVTAHLRHLVAGGAITDLEHGLAVTLTPTTTASTDGATTPNPATGSSTTPCSANEPTPSDADDNSSTSPPGPPSATPPPPPNTPDTTPTTHPNSPPDPQRRQRVGHTRGPPQTATTRRSPAHPRQPPTTPLALPPTSRHRVVAHIVRQSRPSRTGRQLGQSHCDWVLSRMPRWVERVRGGSGTSTATSPGPMIERVGLPANRQAARVVPDPRSWRSHLEPLAT